MAEQTRGTGVVVREVPTTLARMPVSAPAWVWVAYGITVAVLGVLTGSVMGLACCLFAAGFSFQFWVFAAWRGLLHSPAPEETP